jgi:hypothetical protein
MKPPNCLPKLGLLQKMEEIHIGNKKLKDYVPPLPKDLHKDCSRGGHDKD